MEISALSLPPLTETGEVITYYSYNGGGGRSMALSHSALLLARREHASTPVLMIDWDLAAPGLHHQFEHVEDGPGVLEFFEACWEQLRRRQGSVGADQQALAHEVLEAVGWQRYVSRVDQGCPLFLMRAARIDDQYGERLAALHWDQLFDRCPALFRCFADLLARHFRYVLVDASSGRTDSASVCTTLLPSKLVLFFTPERYSLEGAQALVTRATAYRRSHEDEQRPLLVYPLPSCTDMADNMRRQLWRRGAPAQRIVGYQTVFEQLFSACYGMPTLSLDSYFDEVQLQPSAGPVCGERLAGCPEQGGDRFSLTRSVVTLLEWLADGYFPWQSHAEIGLQAALATTRSSLDRRGMCAPSQLLASQLQLLGELHRSQGRWRPAQACFEEALALRQRGLGEDHPDTLDSKASLALLLRCRGQFDAAQSLEAAVLQARVRLLGMEHGDTLVAQAHLALTLAAQGRGAEALHLLDAVHDSYLRQFGPEHGVTLACKASRAELLFQSGDSGAARAAQEQVLASRKRLLGAEHADTLLGKLALAQTLLHMQELDAAHSLFDAVYQARSRRLGAEHPDTRSVREQLIAVRAQRGEPGEHCLGESALHQNAAMDDYGDALVRPRRSRAPARPGEPWHRTHDELLGKY